MPIVLRKKVCGTELILWRITETEEELESAALPEDVASAAEFTSKRRRMERLAWRAALRTAGIRAKVGYSGAGAPFLDDPGLYLSVSHCTGMACVALSDVYCGVDIEAIERNCSRAAARFMSESERILLSGEPNPECAAWCAKEALYKYFGSGEQDLLNDIRITGKCAETLIAVVSGEEALVRILYEEGYVIALAYGGSGS